MFDNKAINEISAGARLLHARLAKVSIGEVVTYEELSKAANVNVLTHRWLLMTARNLARRQQSMIFSPVLGVGLKRLDDVGIAQDVRRDRKAIHKKTVRSLRKVECVQDLAAMPAKERTDLLVTASCLGAIAHASHGGTMKKLEGKVQNATKQLPVSETLAAIG